MPREGHWAYEWPSDLLTPDLVLFLTVSEEVRKQRIQGRGGEKTVEEKHLERDKLFRERYVVERSARLTWHAVLCSTSCVNFVCSFREG
jgi:thymidylate kinase